jgi:hypothetical protein
MKKDQGFLDNLNQSQAAERMNLAEWRKNRLHDMELPSGLRVKVRDVSMTDLMLTGKLPSAIIDMAKNAAENEAKDFDLNALAANAEEFNQMLTALIEICLVEPSIGTVADDQHILLSEIPSDDKMAIFAFVNREATKVTNFREG